MDTWPLICFVICGVFSLVFIRTWCIAHMLHWVREYVETLRDREYIDASIWYQRIEVGRMIIRFWRRPTSFMDEPHRSAYLSWRRRAKWWGTPP